MISFINCPFCSGHEAVSPEAATAIAELIEKALYKSDSPLTPLGGELQNILNVIRNTEEREEPQAEEYTPPICPTPEKRRYVNREAAIPHATKFGYHPYECECHYWHVSKQTPAEHRRKINSPPSEPNEFPTIDPLLL